MKHYWSKVESAFDQLKADAETKIKNTTNLRYLEDQLLTAKEMEYIEIIGRVVWVVLTAILMGFMGWMMKGGFFDTGK